jgi:hypothetical protein
MSQCCCPNQQGVCSCRSTDCSQFGSNSAAQKNPKNALKACLTQDPLKEILRTSTGKNRKGLKAAFLNNVAWPKNYTLKIAFLKYPYATQGGGSTDPQYTKDKADWVEKVIKKYIEPLVGLKFKWDTPVNQSDIRISFVGGAGAWSAVGNQALKFPENQPTMNLGWLDKIASDSDFKQAVGLGTVVVHEFGHALGMIHEHARADARLDWNDQFVYDNLGCPPNCWSKSMVDSNILEPIPVSMITNHSDYDIHSIMHYVFPNNFFKKPPNIPRTTVLSALDKKWISKTYPGGESPFTGKGGGEDIGPGGNADLTLRTCMNSCLSTFTPQQMVQLGLDANKNPKKKISSVVIVIIILFICLLLFGVGVMYKKKMLMIKRKLSFKF